MQEADDEGAETARYEVHDDLGDLDEEVVGLGHVEGEKVEDPFAFTAWSPEACPRRSNLIAFGLEELAQSLVADAYLGRAVEAEGLAAVFHNDEVRSSGKKEAKLDFVVQGPQDSIRTAIRSTW